MFQINLAGVFTVDVISVDDVVFQIHTWLVYDQYCDVMFQINLASVLTVDSIRVDDVIFSD